MVRLNGMIKWMLYPIWEAAAVDEWLYNGGPYELIVLSPRARKGSCWSVWVVPSSVMRCACCGDKGCVYLAILRHVQCRKLEKHQQGHTLDAHIKEQFGGGRLLACISSRPGQCGRSDGYILEGKELEFCMKKIQRKKGKGAAA
uniref:40S ribosomal protein S8 n=1 Tax=Quercus lobata TaxID=97700 RepID=A0A7N2R581_QUELO